MYDRNDLSNSVIMPRDDFIELSTVAFDNSHVPSASERIASTLQATAIFGGLAGCIGAATWLYVGALNWREKRKHARDIAELQFKAEHSTKP